MLFFNNGCLILAGAKSQLGDFYPPRRKTRRLWRRPNGWLSLTCPFLDLFNVICYFPNGKSTTWEIYREYLLIYREYLLLKFIQQIQRHWPIFQHFFTLGFLIFQHVPTLPIYFPYIFLWLVHALCSCFYSFGLCTKRLRAALRGSENNVLEIERLLWALRTCTPVLICIPCVSRNSVSYNYMYTCIHVYCIYVCIYKCIHIYIYTGAKPP